MTNYLIGSKLTQSNDILDAKEKRKKLLEEVRKRRATIQKNFKEKMQNYYRVNTDFPY